MAWQPQVTDVLLKLLITCIISTLIWLTPDAEVKWSAQNYPCGHKDVLRLHQGSSISFRRGPNSANNSNPSATDLYIHSYYYNYYIIVAFVKIVTIWSQD